MCCDLIWPWASITYVSTLLKIRHVISFKNKLVRWSPYRGTFLTFHDMWWSPEISTGVPWWKSDMTTRSSVTFLISTLIVFSGSRWCQLSANWYRSSLPTRREFLILYVTKKNVSDWARESKVTFTTELWERTTHARVRRYQKYFAEKHIAPPSKTNSCFSESQT